MIPSLQTHRPKLSSTSASSPLIHTRTIITTTTTIIPPSSSVSPPSSSSSSSHSSSQQSPVPPPPPPRAPPPTQHYDPSLRHPVFFTNQLRKIKSPSNDGGRGVGLGWNPVAYGYTIKGRGRSGGSKL